MSLFLDNKEVEVREKRMRIMEANEKKRRRLGSLPSAVNHCCEIDRWLKDMGIDYREELGRRFCSLQFEKRFFCSL